VSGSSCDTVHAFHVSCLMPQGEDRRLADMLIGVWTTVWDFGINAGWFDSQAGIGFRLPLRSVIIHYNPLLHLLDNVLHAMLRDSLRNMICSRTPQFFIQYKGGAFQLRVVLHSFSVWRDGWLCDCDKRYFGERAVLVMVVSIVSTFVACWEGEPK
jgi:hypothetical protein